MALPAHYQKEAGNEQLPSQYTMSHLRENPSKVKIRVLTDFIEGKEVFGEKDGKQYPYRFKIGQNIPVGCIGTSKFTGEPNRIKGFLAAIVWNYTTNQVEILSMTNPDLKNGFYDLEHNEDWGDVKNYDVTITRTGEKTETSYSLVPSGMKPFAAPSIQGIDLQELYVVGGNPFKGYTRLQAAQKDESIITTDDMNDSIPF